RGDLDDGVAVDPVAAVGQLRLPRAVAGAPEAPRERPGLPGLGELALVLVSLFEDERDEEPLLGGLGLDRVRELVRGEGLELRPRGDPVVEGGLELVGLAARQ